MQNFTIEKEKDEEIISLSVTKNDKNALVNYNVENVPFSYNSEAWQKKISILDYAKLEKEVQNLSLEKIFRENLDCVFLDGWTLRFSMRSRSTELKIEVQCPSKSESKPETMKLLDFCKKVFDMVGRGEEFFSEK